MADAFKSLETASQRGEVARNGLQSWQEDQLGEAARKKVEKEDQTEPTKPCPQNNRLDNIIMEYDVSHTPGRIYSSISVDLAGTCRGELSIT